MAHVGAGSGADFDQSGNFESDHGLAHRGPADAELLGQELLGRKPRTRRHRAALYLLANAVCDLLIEPLVDDGFKRHAPMLPQSLSGRTAGVRKIVSE